MKQIQWLAVILVGSCMTWAIGCAADDATLPKETQSQPHEIEVASPAVSEMDESAESSQELTLMGISLGAASEPVLTQWGLAEMTFPLPDEEMTAIVHTYSGFMVGIEKDEVLFIEVNSRDVDPRLNGLRVGDVAQQAIEVLGVPDNETDVVMEYMTSAEVLKLELDPHTMQIQSIKLFPRE